MIILRCPNCQKAVVVNTDINIPQQIITCVHCGFTDYLYIYHLSRFKVFLHQSPNMLNVEDVIKIIGEQLKSKVISCTNVDRLVFDLHERCKELSPLVICELINMLLDYSENAPEVSVNDTFFVRYKQECVTLDNIYKKLKEIGDMLISDKSPENSLSSDNFNVEISHLKKDLQSKEKEIDSWVKEYNDIVDKYKKALFEIETLKSILRK